MKAGGEKEEHCSKNRAVEQEEQDKGKESCEKGQWVEAPMRTVETHSATPPDSMQPLLNEEQLKGLHHSTTCMNKRRLCAPPSRHHTQQTSGFPVEEGKKKGRRESLEVTAI